MPTETWAPLQERRLGAPDAGTGLPQTIPATRGLRCPRQNAATGAGTPKRLLPEADALPGPPSDPQLPGSPADPPAWPWALANGVSRLGNQHPSPSLPASARSPKNKTQEDCI